MIELRTITQDNFQTCISLRATVEHADNVDAVVYSLAEAWVLKDNSLPFAIYWDSIMVGYVLMYIGETNPQIINFLIDDRFQGKGYGFEAAKQCIDYLVQEHAVEKISLPVSLTNDKAQKFWNKVGFNKSEDIEDGYLYMRMYI